MLLANTPDAAYEMCTTYSRNCAVGYGSWGYRGSSSISGQGGYNSASYNQTTSMDSDSQEGGFRISGMGSSYGVEVSRSTGLQGSTFVTSGSGSAVTLEGSETGYNTGYGSREQDYDEEVTNEPNESEEGNLSGEFDLGTGKFSAGGNEFFLTLRFLSDEYGNRIDSGNSQNRGYDVRIREDSTTTTTTATTTDINRSLHFPATSRPDHPVYTAISENTTEEESTTAVYYVRKSNRYF